MPQPIEKSIQMPNGTILHYRGPDLQMGALPTVLYFALSGRESLFVDPYNKPAEVLEKGGIRVFSIDLPAHGEGFDNLAAMRTWMEEIKKDPAFLDTFIDHCRQILDFLIQQNYADAKFLGAAGLSRGGYMATLLAANEARISAIVGFAPLTQLSRLSEYLEIQPLLKPPHDLKDIAHKLIGRAICYFIGNRDERVGTKACFDCIQAMTEANYQSGLRSPPVEFHIFPSIGHKGHGTPVEIFELGARWMLANLMKKGYNFKK